MSKVLYSCFLLCMSAFLLHAGDGITHGIEEQQEAEKKRQEAEERRLRELRERAVQGSAQIAQELAAVDKERRAAHDYQQRNRWSSPYGYGDEDYNELAAIYRDRAAQSDEASQVNLQGALMGTGLFYSDGEDKGMAKGQPLPAGLNLGSDVTSARGVSPIVTKQEYDQRVSKLEYSKRVWPTRVYTDDATSALANHRVVRTSKLRCADLQCVDSYGRPFCHGHDLLARGRRLPEDREDEREAQMFVNELIRLSREKLAFGQDTSNGVRQKSLPRGKVDRDGKMVEH